MFRIPAAFAVLLILWLGAGSEVLAHDGPPFPLAVDQRIGPYLMSVWADPDVGIGTFWVMLDPPPGGALPEGTTVSVFAEPLSGRLPEARYEARREPARNREQFVAEIPFDAQEMWRVRVVVQGAEGGGEVVAEVEATPPGFGRWDLAIYLFPFVFIGALWIYGAVRHGRARRASQEVPKQPLSRSE